MDRPGRLAVRRLQAQAAGCLDRLGSGYPVHPPAPHRHDTRFLILGAPGAFRDLASHALAAMTRRLAGHLRACAARRRDLRRSRTFFRWRLQGDRLDTPRSVQGVRPIERPLHRIPTVSPKTCGRSPCAGTRGVGFAPRIRFPTRCGPIRSPRTRHATPRNCGRCTRNLWRFPISAGRGDASAGSRRFWPYTFSSVSRASGA